MEEKDPKKQELNLVYDEDLLPVFEKLGIKDDFIAGKTSCCLCGKPIIQENLYSFFLDGEKIKLVCDEEACVKKLETKN